MSGGAYDYTFHKIDDLASDIREHGGCGDYSASPALRRAFKAHLRKVAAACHAIEWTDSGDGNDREADLIRACIGRGGELAQALEDAKAAKAELERVIREAEASKP